MFTKNMQRMAVLIVLANRVARSARKSNTPQAEKFIKDVLDLQSKASMYLLKNDVAFTKDDANLYFSIDNLKCSVNRESFRATVGDEIYNATIDSEKRPNKARASVVSLDDEVRKEFAFVPSSTNKDNAEATMNGMLGVFNKIPYNESSVMAPAIIVEGNAEKQPEKTPQSPKDFRQPQQQQQNQRQQAVAQPKQAPSQKSAEQHAAKPEVKQQNPPQIKNEDPFSLIQRKLNEIKVKVDDSDRRYTAVNKELQAVKNNLKKREDTIFAKDKDIASLKDSILQNESKINTLEANILGFQAEIAGYKQEKEQNSRLVKQQVTTIAEKELKIRELEENLRQKEADIISRDDIISEKTASIAAKDAIIENYQAAEADYGEQISNQNIRIADLQEQLRNSGSVSNDEVNELIEKHRKEMDNLESAHLKEVSDIKDKYDAIIEEMKREFTAQMDEVIGRYQQQLSGFGMEPEENPTKRLDKHGKIEKYDGTEIAASAAAAAKAKVGRIEQDVKQPKPNNGLPELKLQEQNTVKAETNVVSKPNPVKTVAQGATQYGEFPWANNIRGMARKDFCFTYTRISVVSNTGIEATSFEAIIAPLTTREQLPDLVVWVGYGGGQSNVYTSSKTQKAISTTIGNFPILFSGRMERDEFKAHIALSQSLESSYHLEMDTRTFGKKGHLLLTEGGVHIHVIPATFKNNEEGMANFIYVVDDGKQYKAGDNSSGDIHVYVGIDKVIQCSWNEQKELYATLGLPRDGGV